MHGLDGTSPWADLLSLLPLFAVGAVCSGERMSRLVLVIGLAVVSTYEVTLSLVQVSGPSLTSTLTSRQTWSPLVPAVIAAGLGAMWVPVARLAGRARDSNTFLLISVNVLNVADAILTWAAVHSGDAIETNPIIGLIGLPAKILLVAGASIWVSRTRPRVLVVPLFVLAAVFAYHLIGLRLNN
jgi:hypothetical protein